MYVVVNTHRHGIGAVWGPFNRKREAEQWVAAAEFPYPEQVRVKRVYPVAGSVTWRPVDTVSVLGIGLVLVLCAVLGVFLSVTPGWN